MRRFFIEEMWEKDGYRTARVRFFHDVPEDPDGRAAPKETGAKPASATAPQPDGGGVSGGASEGAAGPTKPPEPPPSTNESFGTANDPALEKLSENELAKQMSKVVKEWLVCPPRRRRPAATQSRRGNSLIEGL